MSEHANVTRSSQESVPAAAAVAASQPATSLHQESPFQQVRMPVQFKLTLGAVDDPQEAEADAMADKVMNMHLPAAAPAAATPVSSAVQRKCAACDQEKEASIMRKCAQCEEEKLHRSPEPGMIQRKCAHCEEEDKKGKLQMKPLAAIIRRSSGGEGTAAVSSEVSAGIGATRGQGSGMSDNTKSFMESRFGADFSNIRIHTGDYAASMSRDLNAQAFTVGNDIYFNNGKYSPETDSGRRLLAHELTHTLQQGASGPDARRKPGHLPISNPIIRRAPDKSAGTTDGPVTLRSWRDGKTTITRSVTRKMKRCKCAGTNDAVTGWFYNPDLRNLALVFSYCKGTTRADMYVKLKDNIPDVIVGGKDPQVTGTGGITVTFPTGKDTSQITVEGKGTNVGAGTGPRAIPDGKPGGGVSVDLNLGLGNVGNQPLRVKGHFDYLHYGNVQGVNPNMWDVNLGAQLGQHGLSADVNQTGGLPTTYGLKYQFSFDKPAAPTRPNCVNTSCICPPPIVEYTCEDSKQEDDTKPETPKPAPPEDFLHYFKYYTTNEPDDADLKEQNKNNLKLVQDKVKEGYAVQYVRGYASPEGKEKEINEQLGEDRGKKFQGMVAEALAVDKKNIALSQGTGELLGAALNNNPESHLVDVIKEYGVQSAQDLSTHLQGKEFGTNKDLTREFLQLFKTVTKPEDRLRIFGLSAGTKLGQRVLTAIDAFVASGGQGERPWEAFFQMYRIALVRLQQPTPPPGKAEHHDATKSKVDANECKQSGLEAESKNLFGKPPVPTGDEAQVANECNDNSKTDGCDYNTPPQWVDKTKLPPPAGAPKQIK